MASWSTKRKFGYFFIFMAAIVVLVGLPAFFVFYKAPTCSDGVKNGTERGVDCGGSCARLCPADFAAPKVLWAYSVRVVPGIYNALAYVQNPNPSVEARDLSYILKLYDAEGILVTQRVGKAFVPAGQRFAVFVAGIDVGKRTPVRATFEFAGEPNWRQGSPLTKLRVLDTSLDQGQGGKPSARVRVRNDAPDRSYANVDATVILYDKNDNRVAFSKTVIPSIGPNETQTLYYTWPEPFGAGIVRTEVLFAANPSR